MELQIISYNRLFPGETAMVTRMLREYPCCFHLRKPDISTEEHQAFLRGVPEDLHEYIILHNAYSLSGEFKLRGLHFSTSKQESANLYQTYKSSSCHSHYELLSRDGKFDQIFISPVFPSISKQGYTGNLDLNLLRESLKTARKSKAIALGGITPINIREISGWGFDGFAVLGYIWGQNPENETEVMNNFQEMYRKFEVLKSEKINSR